MHFLSRTAQLHAPPHRLHYSGHSFLCAVIAIIQHTDEVKKNPNSVKQMQHLHFHAVHVCALTSKAASMELVSVCIARGHLTAPNKTLINTVPLKAPAGSGFVCVRVRAPTTPQRWIRGEDDAEEGRQVSLWSSATNPNWKLKYAKYSELWTRLKDECRSSEARLCFGEHSCTVYDIYSPLWVQVKHISTL